MSKKRGMGYQCKRQFPQHDAKVSKSNGRIDVLTDVQRRCANVLRMAIRFGVPFTTAAMTLAYNARFKSNLSEKHIGYALTRLRDEAECLTMNQGKEWVVVPRAVAIWNSIEHKNRH